MAGMGENLDPRMQREIMELAQQTRAKADFNNVVNKLTNTCFDICVSKPTSKLGYSGEQCFQNCAARFLEASEVAAHSMAQMVEKQASSMGGMH